MSEATTTETGGAVGCSGGFYRAEGVPAEGVPAEAVLLVSPIQGGFLAGLEEALGFTLDARQRFRVCDAMNASGLSGHRPTVMFYAESFPGMKPDEVLDRWLEGEALLRFPEDEPHKVVRVVESVEGVDHATV